MLIIAKSMRQLQFSDLMAVYQEGNLENAEELWPEETDARKLFLAEESFRQYLQESFFCMPGAVYAIWAPQGRYTSALRLEPYRDGLLLEALETHPQYRAKGHATALMEAVLNQFPRQILYSHVGKQNYASLRVHEKMGFQRISDRAVYIDGSVNDRCFTLRFSPSLVCEIQGTDCTKSY